MAEPEDRTQMTMEPTADTATVDPAPKPTDDDQTGAGMGASAGTAEPPGPAESEIPPETDDVKASAHEPATAIDDVGRAPVQGMRDAAPGEINGQPVDLWPNEKITGLRERWQEVQLHFVDDPKAAALEADALVSEAVQTLTDSLVHGRQDLAGWQGDESDDTERLRVAVQRYRGFLDRLLGL